MMRYRLPKVSEAEEMASESAAFAEFAREQAEIERGSRRAQINVGRALLDLRRDMHLNQEEMAALMGVSTRSYQGYEKNERDVPSSALIELYVQKRINLHALLVSDHEPGPSEKANFFDHVVRVMKWIKLSYPDLDDEEVIDVARIYIRSSKIGVVDGGEISASYSQLFNNQTE